MRKSAFAIALLTLPLLSACTKAEQAVAPATTSAAASTSPAAASTAPKSSAAATTTPGSVPTGTLSAGQISQSLQDKGHLDQKTADCIANIYVAEGISQSGIRVILNSDYTSGAASPTELGLTMDDVKKATAATKRVVSECI
ncbi:hypothetical protein [Nocardia yamanashiensis]|uniref:hypothetical protein n=1 Tax=Nocardia yamanashiensis TaxID=209247 RepID=UPI0008360231|nr:hypothetical protein [Nocardia yamanashiensis]